MPKRFWFLSVGPFDEEEVTGWIEDLGDHSDGLYDVEVIDNRQWYARALDADSVRDALVVLRAGVSDVGVSEEVRSSVLGLVSDMETWLDREFDASVNPDAMEGSRD